MNSIERSNAWFWGRVALSAQPAMGGFGLLRLISGLYVLLLVAPHYHWVSAAPPGFFGPPLLSFMRLASGFPRPALTTLLDGSVIVALCCLTLGVRARLSSLALVVLSLVSNNVVYSFGKIDHDILLWVFFGCMAFSGWGRSLALLPDRPSRFDRPERSLALLGVCLAFAMSAAGVHKALHWLDFDLHTSGFLGWFAYGYFNDGRHYLLARQVLRIPPLGFELIDYAGVSFEVSSLLALIGGARAWRCWLAAACIFHLLNTLTLNIPFLAHIPVYLAFVDFGGAQAKLASWWERPAVRWGFTLVVVSLCCAHLVLGWAGRGHALLLVVDEVRRPALVLRVSAAVLNLAALVVVLDLLREWRRSTNVGARPRTAP
jgi:hypothetical protein